MENLDAFVKYWTGRNDCDFDHVYGGQCVDLVLFYQRDVLGIPTFHGNAIDEFGQDSPYITWVANNPKDAQQIPYRGDIVIWQADWKVGTGVFGHTAIVLEAFETYFVSFDQNWPVNHKPGEVHHTYEGVKGWGAPHPLAKPAPKPVPIVVLPPAPVPTPSPIARPKMYLYNFHPSPPDDTHPAPQVTTTDDAVAQAYTYVQAHAGATCDVVITVGPVVPPDAPVDVAHNKSELQ